MYLLKTTINLLMEEPQVFPFNKELWKEGGVTRISFGYGSRHDLQSFYIAICDSCTEKLIKENIIVDTKDISKKISELSKRKIIK
jgi:hypothetical protein